MVSPFSKFQREVSPSILLYIARFPSGETERDTCARVWGLGKVAFGGWGWPAADDHCFTDPSAETDITVSFWVHDTPHTASECATESHESEQCWT